jgi:MFS family permease
MRHNTAIFLASFMTLIAAGMGFSIRAGVLADWGAAFGFTKTELGAITGGGLVGFGITIIACSLIVDRIGYKSLMVLAFLLHVASAVVTVAATPIYDAYGKEATYWVLYIGMFMFALANGVCESVINPLVATLYPRQKTHYLNILHAGWPGGLIVGGVLAWLFVGDGAKITHLRWEIPMLFFLVPVLYYGVVTLKERFPISEARAAGVTFGTMLAQFAAPVMLMLLVLHALVGYVELGTDSWIPNIMQHVVSGEAVLVLVYTAGIMFVLRFFAGPIVERINPVGLLFVSSLLGVVGLYWLGSSVTVGAIFAAATVYGVGKTFLWPTMLGVVGERFPRGGALTMGAVGGVGMLSAGLLGAPGIGYFQDVHASQKLQELSAETYERYRADQENAFLVFDPVTGLDGSKVEDLTKAKPESPTEVIDKRIAELERVIQEEESRGDTADTEKLESARELLAEYRALKPHATEDLEPVKEAGFYGARMALKLTAYIPAAMAVGYLILLLYFRAKGGYKQEVLHGAEPEGEEYTGGVEGPVR